MESWEEIKQKVKKKYLPDFYKHRLLDKLHSLRQGGKSVQEHTIEFDDLTYVARCEKTPTKQYLGIVLG